MELFFITGNKGKFLEMQELVPGIKQLELDLLEIQEIDSKKIIEEKLKEAFNHHSGRFIVEDTSLTFEALGSLPGPLIKWFLESLKPSGLFHLTNSLGNSKATATTIIGYAKNEREILFFEGSLSGTIVNPRGEGFGWDSVFQPEGLDKTFGEMSKEQKNQISHRFIAASKLARYLQSNG